MNEKSSQETEGREESFDDRKEAEKETPTVLSMSPEYPRHRDPLIIMAAIVIFFLLIGGALLFIKGINIPLGKFARNPARYLTQLIMGPEIYDVCKSYLSENEDKFSEIGPIQRYSLAKAEIKSLGRRKTATVIMKVQGSKGKGRVRFRLRKQRTRWVIVSVAIETATRGYRKIYPKTTRKAPADLPISWSRLI